MGDIKVSPRIVIFSFDWIIIQYTTVKVERAFQSLAGTVAFDFRDYFISQVFVFQKVVDNRYTWYNLQQPFDVLGEFLLRTHYSDLGWDHVVY